MKDRSDQKEVVAWVLYDWANSVFSTAIIVVFFPILLEAIQGSGSNYLATIHLITGVALGLSAPILGTIADKAKCHRNLLLVFAFLGAVFTCLPGVYSFTSAFWLGLVFGLSQMSFGASIIFYDSLLKKVSLGRNIDYISSLGYAFGYLGGAVQLGMCMYLYKLLTNDYGFLEGQAIQYIFLFTAFWWLLFSTPLFLIKEPKDNEKKFGLFSWKLITEGFFVAYSTFQNIRLYKKSFLVLLAYWFYIDGVNTIAKMAVKVGIDNNLSQESVISAILLAQVIGFPSTLLIGWLSRKVKVIYMILTCLFVYLIIVAYAYFVKTETEFYIMAASIGGVQGGVQALSRSHFASLIPEGKTGEFFGLFNLIGRFASILGPGIIYTTGVLFNDDKLGVTFLSLLFLVGAILLIVSERIKKDT